MTETPIKGTKTARPELPADLATLTVVQLRAALADRGLAAKGKKDALVQALAQFEQQQADEGEVADVEVQVEVVDDGQGPGLTPRKRAAEVSTDPAASVSKKARRVDVQGQEMEDVQIEQVTENDHQEDHQEEEKEDQGPSQTDTRAGPSSDLYLDTVRPPLPSLALHLIWLLGQPWCARL